MENKSNIDKWVEGGFNKELLQQLKEEYPNDIELLKAEEIVNATQNLKPNYKVSKEQLWNNIEDSIAKNVVPLKPKKSNDSRMRWMAAASIIVVAGIFGLWNMLRDSSNDGLLSFSTGVSETAEIKLPDNSKVFINGTSKVEYNKGDWPERKSIDLSGEAFFNVVKGGTFVVETDLGKVTVLGTSFNVKARDNLFVVSCKTGKVRVNNNDGEEFDLTPGMSVRFVNGKSTIQTNVNSDHMDSWVLGKFYFTDVQLKEIFNEFENQFNVKIIVDDEAIFEKQYTGFFNVNNKVDKAIEDVCLPLNLHYEISEDRREIKINN